MNFETDRCIIRPFNAEDIDAFMSYRNDMGWMKYQGFKGLSKQEYMQALLYEHSLSNGVQLAIICKQTNILIGDLYLKQEGDTCWIGYTITPLKSRCGYAYEAVSALICSLTTQGINRVKASVAIGNDASVMLLEKLKFTFLGIEADEQIFQLND